LFRQSKISEVIDFVNTELNGLIKNYSPLDQEELDEKISKLFHSKQQSAMQTFLFSNKAHESMITKDNNPSKTPSTPTQSNPSNNKKNAAAPAPKQKQSANNPTAASTNFIAPSTDELNNYFQSSFFASFMESVISKAICLAGAKISYQEPFDHIMELKNMAIIILKNINLFLRNNFKYN
jgi:hypothetical protein